MVWRNAAMLGALAHPGHAVLLLRRARNEGPWEMLIDEGVPTTYNPAYADNEIRYVSFWPGDDHDKENKGGLIGRTSGDFLAHHLQDYYRELGGSARTHLSRINDAAAALNVPRRGQIVIGTETVGNGRGGGTDHDIWGQEPNERVTLAGLCSARPGELGLAMNEIVRWTTAFSNTAECTYTFVTTSRNCAGVAVRAMAAGGADAFAAIGGNPSKGNLYITPCEAEIYANAVRTGIQLVNQMLVSIRNNCLNAPPVIPDTDLMSAADFKTRSAVAWKIRGQMLRNIDSALEKYHTFTWAGKYPEKLAEFVTIIKNTHNHIVASRSGLRDAAFQALSVRILEVVRQRAVISLLPWPGPIYYGDRDLIGAKK
jgi:hypothetical protein